MLNIQSIKVKDKQNLHLYSPIVRISSCREYFAVGCLDQSLRIWPTNLTPFNPQPYFLHRQMVSSISDISFKQKSTHVATSSMQSTIKIWDLDTKVLSTIQAPIFSATKLLLTNHNIITCGQAGKIVFYDLVSKEIVKKLQIGDSMLNAIGYCQDINKFSVGNMNGDMYLLGTQKKQDILHFKPHHRTIRSVNFYKNSQALITTSDDTTISITDIATSTVSHRLQGHSQRVNNAKPLKKQQNIIISCSNDKTIKIWDLRTSKCVHNHLTNGPLWDLQIIDNNIITGGQLGILHILSIE